MKYKFKITLIALCLSLCCNSFLLNKLISDKYELEYINISFKNNCDLFIYSIVILKSDLITEDYHSNNNIKSIQDSMYLLLLCNDIFKQLNKVNSNINIDIYPIIRFVNTLKTKESLNSKNRDIINKLYQLTYTLNSLKETCTIRDNSTNTITLSKIDNIIDEMNSLCK